MLPEVKTRQENNAMLSDMKICWRDVGLFTCVNAFFDVDEQRGREKKKSARE